MGMHLKQTAVAGFTNPAAAAETAVYTTPVMQPMGPAATQNPVSISGTINLTPGTAATAVVVKLRQGVGVGGAQVGPSYTHTVAAAAPQSITFGFTDSTGFLEGGGQYTLTVTVTSATGATTINAVDFEVLILWHRQESSARQGYSRRRARTADSSGPLRCGRLPGWASPRSSWYSCTLQWSGGQAGYGIP